MRSFQEYLFDFGFAGRGAPLVSGDVGAFAAGVNTYAWAMKQPAFFIRPVDRSVTVYAPIRSAITVKTPRQKAVCRCHHSATV